MTVARLWDEVSGDLRPWVTGGNSGILRGLIAEALDAGSTLAAELDAALAVIAEVRAAIDQYEGVSSPPLGLHACLSAIAEAVGR